MLNDIRMTISGNVTREPEVKFRRSDGRPFTVVPIAVNERRYDQQSNQYVQTGTTYYDIICPGTLGGNVLHSVTVGTPVVAHGRFTVHEWATDTARGARPQVRADSLGVDLTWGTTSYTRGSRPYPQAEPEYETSTPPSSEGGPAADQDLAEDDMSLPDGLAVDEDGVVHGEEPVAAEEEKDKAKAAA